MKKPQKDPLPGFGKVVGGVFFALGALLLWRHSWGSIFGAVFLILGTGLILFGLLVPRFLAPVYKGWMFVAFVLGWINTRLLLAALFFVGFTLARLYLLIRRQDPMLRRPDGGRSTYWVDTSGIEMTAESLERQF